MSNQGEQSLLVLVYWCIYYCVQVAWPVAYVKNEKQKKKKTKKNKQKKNTQSQHTYVPTCHQILNLGGLKR